MKRRGDWMQTAGGRQFWPIDPRASEIDITDIAHALSMLCRFGGHCLRFYSVAEHSVHVSRNVPKKHALWALLHDATEAYLVDVPRPIKPSLKGYHEAEARLMAAVCKRFKLRKDMPAEVKLADNSILFDEAAQNMSKPPAAWKMQMPPLGVKLKCWHPEKARREFLKRYRELTKSTAELRA